jgi:hypothetical protein
MRGAILPLPNTLSWRGAELKKAEGQLYLTFTSTESGATVSVPMGMHQQIMRLFVL